MRLVVDASVSAKWIIPGEPGAEAAIALKNAIASLRVEAYAPTLLVYELASVMLRSIRKGLLAARDGADAIKAVGLLGVKLISPSWEETADILKIARSSNLTIYDSAYLWLSGKIGGKLVTADEEIKRRGRDIAEIVSLEELADILPGT